MIPPVFRLAKADARCVSLLTQGSILKVFQFGMAPQDVTDPYAVWQIVGGGAENYLADAPDHDSITIQLDVYGKTAPSVRDCAVALRDAWQVQDGRPDGGYLIAWIGESRDPTTMRYRCTFRMDWILPRQV